MLIDSVLKSKSLITCSVPPLEPHLLGTVLNYEPPCNFKHNHRRRYNEVVLNETGKY